ncbi:MAG TPA: TolC family protein [Cytophagales bacterium]|nr:TolC family protein [Cytophagales bacterium]
MKKRVAVLLSVLIYCSPSVLMAQTKSDSLQTIDLKTALKITLENYPSIRLKRAETEAAKFDLRATQTNYIPNFIVQGQMLDGTSNQVRGPFFPNEGMAIPVSGGIKPNGYSATSTWTSYATGFVNWKVFNFGKFKSAVDASRANLVAMQTDYQNEIFQQQIKVSDAYLLTLMANDMVRSQQANLTRVGALRDVTKAYTKSGLKPGVDSSLVQAEYSKATLQYLEAVRLASEQQVYLKELMGFKSDVSLLLYTTIYTSQQPQAFDATNEYSKNPRLLFYKSVVDANEAKIKSIRRSEYPSISLIAGSWARGSGIGDKQNANGDFMYDKSFSGGVGFRPYLDWLVGVSTIWNVTTLFKTGNEAKAQRQITTMAQERYNEETLRVESEVERARLRYAAALEAARQAPVQLRAAQDAYQQAAARYNAGLSTIMELTQTFALLNRAEVDAGFARGNVWRAVILYAAATGNLDVFIGNLN